MDGFRYVVGLLTALSLPPAIAYWLAIHPFVSMALIVNYTAR